MKANTAEVITMSNRTSILSKIPGVQWLLLIIPLAYMLILLFFPMLDLFKISFIDDDGFTLEYVMHIFTNPLYLKVLWITFKISFLTTVICLLISYPIAYLAVKIKSQKMANIIIALTIIPFWISELVRSFSWIVILQNEGVINKLLMTLGIISEPISLLYQTSSVVIGMVHVMYPFMFFSLYAVMKGIDPRLQLAAEGLGGRPIHSFFQIFFPLTVPGIIAGSLLVFVLSLGFFIVPALIGGPDDMMISVVIESYVNKILNWHLASALSLVLFVSTILLIVIVFFILRNQKIIKDVM